MWIENVASVQHLQTWVKHCPAMKLVTTLEGKILWANAAFCDWSNYSIYEVQRLTLNQISVLDENEQIDLAGLSKLDSYNPAYTIQRRLTPRGGRPEWGSFNALRYPLTGTVECCLCTWAPLMSGTAPAFTLAMEHAAEVKAKLVEVVNELKTLTSQTEEDRFTLSAIRLTQKHPKAIATFVFIAATVLGLNNIVELLRTAGLVDRPVTLKVEKE